MNLLSTSWQSVSGLSPLERVGWVLMQSLWQQALVAVALWIALLCLRRRAARVRYAVACTAIGMMALLPALTTVAAFAPRTDAVRAARELSNNATSLLSVQVAAPNAPGTVPARNRPLMPIVLRAASWSWIAGVVVLSIWNLLGWLRVMRLRRTSSPASSAWTRKLSELAKKLRIHRDVAIGVCEHIAAPAVVGWLRPLVLAPASALAELPADQLEAILLHELAHIQRHDYLVNLVQTMIETLLFYHPAVWWVGTKIREERENCCDDVAVEACGSPMLYARALAAMEELRAPRIGTLALGAAGGSLLRRIERLVGRPQVQVKQSTAPLAGAIAVLLIFLLALLARQRPAFAEQPQPQAARTPAESRPADLDTVHPQDLELGQPVEYRMGPNDQVMIMIADLKGPNTETQKQARVSESGNIGLPLLDVPIRVAGMTEFEAEQAIVKAYRAAGLIQHANVSVTIVEARGLAYWITGAVRSQGQYPILRTDFRLLAAISTAHGTTTSEIASIRVIRHTAPGKPARTIDVPPSKLLSGDQSVNLLIHPNDQIIVTAVGDQPFPRGVLLRVGQNSLSLDERNVTWSELEWALENVPERGNTVLKIVPWASNVTVGRFFDVQRRAGELAKKLGFKRLEVVTETR